MEYFSSLPGKPFVTEFGAQALPDLETLKKMFKPEDLWPPRWEAWAYRDFTYEQYFNVAGQGTGRSIEEFVRISQGYQAGLLKFAIETYRRHRFTQIFGLFHFLLLEPWPCISYSVVDHFRKKKMGFEALKSALQPVLLVYVPERSTLTIGDRVRGTFYLINDLDKKVQGARFVMRLEGEEKSFEACDFRMDIGSNSCKEVTDNVYSLGNSLLIPDGMPEGEYRLILEIFDQNNTLISQNSYEINLKRVPSGLLEFGAVF
jgi:beta-mannosidase